MAGVFSLHGPDDLGRLLGNGVSRLAHVAYGPQALLCVTSTLQ